jgi:hypothetical protein
LFGGRLHYSQEFSNGGLYYDQESNNGGLHYGQESIGEELCTWMNKWHGCKLGDTFLKGYSMEVKFLGQPQSLGQET